MDFTYPENVKFKCVRCGVCCGDTKQKTRRILLLRSEVEKIASFTCRPILDFSVEIEDGDPYVYEMKKSKEGKCVFLKDDQCSIYSLRPLICVFYPFELKFNENKDSHSFDFTFECPGINHGKSMTKADYERLFVAARERLI